MQIKIHVGHAERHEVLFELSPALETLQVTIDGEPSIFHCQLLPFFPLRWVSTNGLAQLFRYSSPVFSRLVNYSFVVGRDELHTIRVEQETNFWFGPLTREVYRVFIDNVPTDRADGGGGEWHRERERAPQPITVPDDSMENTVIARLYVVATTYLAGGSEAAPFEPQLSERPRRSVKGVGPYKPDQGVALGTQLTGSQAAPCKGVPPLKSLPKVCHLGTGLQGRAVPENPRLLALNQWPVECVQRALSIIAAPLKLSLSAWLQPLACHVQ